MINFFERLFFNTKWYHLFIIMPLLPISILYGLIGLVRRAFIRAKSFHLPIVSIGNLLVGGTGKTPFAIALIEYLQKKGYKGIFYISRGYGRDSKGLVVVKSGAKICCSVAQSGDEAMLVAKKSGADVIVSEDRVVAIKRAKELGAKIIILDDAFSKVGIAKFDILLEPKKIVNFLPLPAGPFREFFFFGRRANLILKEGVDFKREVTFENLTDKMLLFTAIANPNRLDAFLPNGVVAKYYLPDHTYFTKEQILEKMREFSVKSFLVTQKDYVKLESFDLPISLMKLELKIKDSKLQIIENYIKEKLCIQ